MACRGVATDREEAAGLGAAAAVSEPRSGSEQAGERQQARERQLPGCGSRMGSSSRTGSGSGILSFYCTHFCHPLKCLLKRIKYFYIYCTYRSTTLNTTSVFLSQNTTLDCASYAIKKFWYKGVYFTTSRVSSSSFKTVQKESLRDTLPVFS